ncbi:MAG TPA: pirin-like C-terminal cupin domain-containing protein [Gemmatimonadaceae bacterium]|nr:pirin-like C-terminal cupin domain-containing protein [Gemmatimonadaceae bacterium]
MPDRGIGRVVTTAPPSPGFIGEGHTAVAVVEPNDFVRTDPFIVLMDDRIDLEPGREAGGPHPHGGFETVTFVVEGELRDRDEGTLKTGDVLWMTAGSGVIHNENTVPLGKSRILQLWLTLPHDERWAAPRFEHIARDEAPVRREPGAQARVYSGVSGSARATTRNYVPVTLVDVRLEPGARFEQELPDSYNGFMYVLEGGVSVGDERTELTSGQVGWLAEALADTSAASSVRIIGGQQGGRIVLYAGERQDVPILMHGPFVGESRADLMRLSRQYLDGKMPRMSELAMEATSGNRN